MFVGTSWVFTDPGPRYRRGDNLMTTATPTRSRRGSPQSADKRRARQEELLGALADGVQALTTSDGWRRYLRAMSTLRTYSTGNTHISKSRECTCNTLQIVVLVTRQARAVEPPRRRASEPATVSGSGA
jgi:hypothetical protein